MYTLATECRAWHGWGAAISALSHMFHSFMTQFIIQWKYSHTSSVETCITRLLCVRCYHLVWSSGDLTRKSSHIKVSWQTLMFVRLLYSPPPPTKINTFMTRAVSYDAPVIESAALARAESINIIWPISNIWSVSAETYYVCSTQFALTRVHNNCRYVLHPDDKHWAWLVADLTMNNVLQYRQEEVIISIQSGEDL